jgi:hypothetical protein
LSRHPSPGWRLAFAASNGGVSFVSYRTDTGRRMGDDSAMPRYTFTIDDVLVADPDATEDLADNHAAMESAKLIAKDLARNNPARNHHRVVVKNEAGDEIGDVPLQVDLR